MEFDLEKINFIWAIYICKLLARLEHEVSKGWEMCFDNEI